VASRPTREAYPFLYDPLMPPVGDHEIAVKLDNLPGVIDSGEEHPTVGDHEGREGSRDSVLDVP